MRYVLGLGPGDRIRPRTQPADADGGAGVAAAPVVPAPMFEAMRLLLGARTPIVLLLRDPVARYRSAGWLCRACAWRAVGGALQVGGVVVSCVRMARR